MALFHYKAKNSSGEFVEGDIEASSEGEAIKSLSSQSIFPLSLVPAKEAKSKSKSQAPKVHLPKFKKSKVKRKHVLSFTRQLGYLLRGGVPLIRSFELLEDQMDHPKMKEIVGIVKQDIHDGKRLSESLEAYQSIFGPFYLNLIRSGEAVGKIDDVLERLVAHIEREEELVSRVSLALVYPSSILFVGILTVFFILTFVVPKMQAMYEDMGQALPFLTQMIVILSGLFAKFWYLWIALFAGVAFGVWKLFQSKRTHIKISEFVLTIPIVGPLLLKEEIIRFSSTLGLLLINGISILEGLKSTAAVMQICLFRQDLEEAYSKVQEGKSFSLAVKGKKFFPSLAWQLLQVGEEMGATDEALRKIGEIYNKELERDLKLLVTIIEPLLILIIGGMVGVVAVAMILPIFQISVI